MRAPRVGLPVLAQGLLPTWRCVLGNSREDGGYRETAGAQSRAQDWRQGVVRHARAMGGTMSDVIHDASVAGAIRSIVPAARLALNRTACCRLKLVASTTDSRAASAASSTSIIGSRIAISSMRFGVQSLMLTHRHPRWLIQYVVASRAAVRESTELIEDHDRAVRNAGRSRGAVQLKHGTGRAA